MPTVVDRSLSSLTHLLIGRLKAESREDTELLTAFRDSRDEVAFATLVARHGPVVWGVCRRGLSDPSDAEDAFQATFLVLVRQIDRALRRKSLSGWLHAVARQVTFNMRRSKIRRGVHERVAASGRTEVTARIEIADIGTVLDEEVARLPDKVRNALVLCYLQGKTLSEAARELRCPVTTLSDRLARGAELLRRRLVRRGVVLSIGQVVTTLVVAGGTGLAAVPAGLSRVATAAALSFSAGAPAITAAGEAALGVLNALGSSRKSAYVLLLVAATGFATAVGVGLPRLLPVVVSAPNPGPSPVGSQPADLQADGFGDLLPAGAEQRIGTLRFRTGRFDGDSSIAFGPGGKVLISAHGGDEAYVWDPATGREVRRLKVPAVCCGLDTTADGSRLVTAGASEVWAWDIAAEPPRLLWKTTTDAASHSAIEYSPDGRLAATAGTAGKSVLLLDAATGAAVRVLTGRGTRFAFSPDSKRLATWNRLGSPEVRIWDVASGVEQRTLPAGEGEQVVGNVAFSPDGKTVATVGQDHRLRLWNVETGEVRHTFATNSSPIAFLDFALPGAIGTLVEMGDGRVRYWDPNTGREARPAGTAPSGAWSWGYKRSAQGGVVAIAHSSGVSLWDCKTGRARGTTADVPSGPVYIVKFSPDGATLATSSYDQAAGTEVHLWDATNGQLRKRLTPGPRQLIWGVAIAGPDAVAYTGEVGESFADLTPPSRVARWDAKSGEARAALPIPSDHRCSAFSADGRWIASCRKNVIGVHDAANGREVHRFTGSPQGLAFSAEGDFLSAVDAGGRVTVWSLTEKRERKWAPPPTPGMHVRFCPSIALSLGGRLAAVGEAGPGGAIRVIDLDAGIERFRLECPLQGLPTQEIAFSPDGRLLAAGGVSGVVRVWEVASGLVRHSFAGHRSEVLAVAFSPDSRRLASGSLDSTALVWNVRRVSGPKARTLPNDLWADLTSKNGETAHRAVVALTEDSGSAITLLKERLSVSAKPSEQVRQWLTDLGDDQYPVREAATQKLASKGYQMEGVIRKALAETDSVEARARLRLLLDRLGPQSPSGWAVVRGIEALERIGPRSDVITLLKELARQPEGSLVGREARAASRRLAPSTTDSPTGPR